MKKVLVVLAVLFPFIAVSVEIIKGAPITSFALFAAIVVGLAVTVVVALRTPATPDTANTKPVWEESLNK